MKIYIASDHGGYEYKEELKKYFSGKGHGVEDMGPFELDPDDDYPDFVIACAEKVAQEEGSFGIILGRSGNGEAIAANKVKTIRAVLCLNEQMAKMAREHNNANILAIGADLIDLDTVRSIVDVFLNTPFSNEERHKRRLKKIADYESSNS